MSAAIGCTECRETQTRVVDSRPAYDRGSVRRRRECLGCGARWNTLELEEDRVALLEDGLGTHRRRPVYPNR